MNILVVLIPVSILLGGLGLAACIWTLRHGQYEDLEGDAARILMDEDDSDGDAGRQSDFEAGDEHAGSRRMS
ncbi:cbb3-type cytochrome oxidase assembly protein CcoS [Maribius pontilimi]|uniref:Cbb3-type cytochrome oxidase assembly protein CcoS n=1 Tax=Palleronia pontilimi TaxID=1964209 RepID=A0A934IF92_9RHOB|nr:cbb3-type cytochrome oxidase assembly protein CcoS [Palleronia pontilimi]MBJ3763327.1 cbb3-type cytochrome oxidase assembly protein CcoS [Palleronia pontilimi]